MCVACLNHFISPSVVNSITAVVVRSIKPATVFFFSDEIKVFNSLSNISFLDLANTSNLFSLSGLNPSYVTQFMLDAI